MWCPKSQLLSRSAQDFLDHIFNRNLSAEKTNTVPFSLCRYWNTLHTSGCQCIRKVFSFFFAHKITFINIVAVCPGSAWTLACGKVGNRALRLRIRPFLVLLCSFLVLLRSTQTFQIQFLRPILQLFHQMVSRIGKVILDPVLLLHLLVCVEFGKHAYRLRYRPFLRRHRPQPLPCSLRKQPRPFSRMCPCFSQMISHFPAVRNAFTKTVKSRRVPTGTQRQG